MANENRIDDQAIKESLTSMDNRINALFEVCKLQSNMIQSLIGSKPANLDNCTENNAGLLSEEDSNMAKNKIKRRVTIDGELVWITAETEQEYSEKLLAAANMRFNKVVPESSKHLFREYAQSWFETYSKPNVDQVTAVTYERQLRLHLNPVLGDMYVENIKPLNVQEVFNRIQGAKETKYKAKTVLNMILEQALEDDIIVKNPLSSRSIRISGRSAKPTAPYSIEQMQHIVSNLSAVKRPDDRAFIALMSLHPLRLEECLGLKYADIDRSEHMIHIVRSVTHPTRNQPHIKQTKTELSRRDIELAAGILNHLPEGRDDDFLLGGDAPLSYTQLRRMLNRIRKDIGFEETIVPQRFRTTVLTDIYDTTKDIKKTQAAAGHTTAAMTLKHYVKGRNPNLNTAEPVSARYGLSNA